MLSSLLRAPILVATALPLLSGTPSSKTRPESSPRSVPFAIAVTDSFPYRNADAVILRRVSAKPHDVIVIKQGKATGPRIAASIRELEFLRAALGNEPTSDALYRVKSTQTPRETARLERTAVQYARKLAIIEARRLEGVGLVRHILLAVPGQQGR